jgi:hypothetical protein
MRNARHVPQIDEIRGINENLKSKVTLLEVQVHKAEVNNGTLQAQVCMCVSVCV